MSGFFFYLKKTKYINIYHVWYTFTFKSRRIFLIFFCSDTVFHLMLKRVEYSRAVLNNKFGPIFIVPVDPFFSFGGDGSGGWGCCLFMFCFCDNISKTSITGSSQSDLSVNQ